MVSEPLPLLPVRDWEVTEQEAAAMPDHRRRRIHRLFPTGGQRRTGTWSRLFIDSPPVPGRLPAQREPTSSSPCQAGPARRTGRRKAAAPPASQAGAVSVRSSGVHARLGSKRPAGAVLPRPTAGVDMPKACAGCLGRQHELTRLINRTAGGRAHRRLAWVQSQQHSRCGCAAPVAAEAGPTPGLQRLSAWRGAAPTT